MSYSDRSEVCLFSSIEAVVVLNGEPVKNAKVTRTYEYNKKVSEETFTNDKGEFSFPSALHSPSLGERVLPQEFVVGQLITLDYEGEHYRIWSGSKRRREEHAEGKGKPVIAVCRLEEEPRVLNISGGFTITNCYWDVEEDIIDNGF